MYKIPSRQKIEERIEQKYSSLSAAQKTKLSNADYISLTCDIWTDTNTTQSYIGLTAHYVCSKSTQLISLTIGVKAINDRHTSENLKTWLIDLLAEWKIHKDKVVVILTDNAANICKAARDIFGASRHSTCFAHNLNLVAAALIKENKGLANLCTKVKAIVTYVRHSTTASDKLKKEKCSALIQSVETRWNSTFYMLERFLEVSQKLSSILLQLPDSPTMLNATDMLLCKDVVSVLRPLEIATRELSGENYVTGSKVIPMINCLINSVNKLKLESEVGNDLKLELIAELMLRFKNVENVLPLAIATLTDPRFKRMHMNNATACSFAITTISNEIRKLSNETSTVVEPSNISDSDSVDPSDIWAYHRELASKVQVRRVENDNENLPADLKHFFDQPVLDLKANPIEFWYNSHGNIYPHLSRVARPYLCVPATSVPCERVFSRAKNILTPLRNRTTPEHAQQLLFLHDLPYSEWNFNK